MAEDTLLHPNGLFNPTLRFAFTNISAEDFTSFWGGQPISIKAGQSVELPHHLAVKLTRELVDKIIMGEAKMDEVNYYEKNPNTAPNMYRSPKGLNLGIPQVRKQYEDKICRLMSADEEDPQMQVKKAMWKQELLDQMNTEVSREPVPVPSAQLSGNANAKLPEVFAELKEGPKEKPVEKPAMKLKSVKE